MCILNLTQHNITKEQEDAGVIEPREKQVVRMLLTFEEFPTEEDIIKRAKKLAFYASKYLCNRVMIGGAPFLMPSLTRELLKVGKIPVCAFSRRVVEEVHDKGDVIKVSVFRHQGFIELSERSCK